MRAAVLSIGSELVEGYLTDTNATFLAQELSALGIELVHVTQVGDNLDRIVRAFRRAWEDADLIVTTGGIGPTADDLTREAIACLLDEEVSVDPGLLAAIEAFFKARGIPMPEQNSKQAWLIPSAEALPNPMGTAPGWFVRKAGHVIVTMPGVPREMTRMWREQAVPRLQPMLGGRAVVSRTLKTIGIGESAAERQIADIIARGNPVVATYAKDDGVHVRITAAATDPAVAEEMVRQTEAEVRVILRAHVYGVESTTLGAAILAPLVESGNTLAIAEAGAGGRITTLISEEPAAVVHFQGGIVRAFEHAASDHGVPSTDPDAPAEVARREARAARTSLRADFGLGVAVRLVPGPTLDQTRGEVAMVLEGAETRERRHELTAVPAEIRRRAGLWAAEFLWNALRESIRTAR